MQETVERTQTNVVTPMPHAEIKQEIPEELKPYQDTIDPEFLPFVVARYNEARRISSEILKTAQVEDVATVEGYLGLLRKTADLVAGSPYIKDVDEKSRETKITDRLDEDVTFMVLKEFIREKLTGTRDLQHDEWTLVNEALGPLKNNEKPMIGPNANYKDARRKIQARCVEEINEQSGTPDRAKRLQEIIEDVLRDVLVVHEKQRSNKYYELRQSILPHDQYTTDSYNNAIIKIANASIIGDEWPGVIGIDRVWKPIEKTGPSYDELDDMTTVGATLKNRDEYEKSKLNPREIVIG